MPRLRRRGSTARITHTDISGPGAAPTQMTAAAQILHSQKIQRAGTGKQKKSTSQAWQADAWLLYDEIGELWFSTNWAANNLSRVRLYAARITDDQADPAPLADGPAAELVADFAGGAGGQAAFLSRIGAHLSLVGDSYIVGKTCISEDGNPGAEVRPAPAAAAAPADPSVRIGPDVAPAPEEAEVEWQAFSTDEVSWDGCWRVDDGFDTFDITDQDLIIRCWRPHPRKWSEAQSAVRSSLPVLRELRGLTMAVSAQIDSRLAGAGILFLPQSMTFAGPDAGQEGDAADGQDSFIRDLIEHMLTPIKDRDSAAAVVPLVVKVPDDSIGKVQHITFASPLDDKAQALRDECLRRFAIGQDMPSEVILGQTDANHWSAWLVDEQAVRAHVSPMAAAVVLALTVGWLQPALEAMGILDADQFMVWFDVSALVHRPDRTTAALDLHDRLLVSDATVRREAGFGEEDAPDAAEFTRLVLLQLLKTGGDITPILRALGIAVDVTPAAGAAPAVAAGPAAPAPAPATNSDPRAIPVQTETP